VKSFTLSSEDGFTIPCYEWEIPNPKGFVQIIHGMGEHAGRYDWAANQLNKAGYHVIANDQRGHGRAIKEIPGETGEDGWIKSIKDAYKVNSFIRDISVNPKIFLLGHSMGSSLAIHYACLYGNSIDSLILSGPPGFISGFQSFITRCILKFEAFTVGKGKKSKLMQQILFGKPNEDFETSDSTGFEWLSRDKELVSKYVLDDQCGFVLTIDSLSKMFEGMRLSQRQHMLMRIPSSLSINIIAGEDDPIHRKGVGILAMMQKYEKVGLRRVHLETYPGARHELLNETNKNQVIANLVNWMETKR
jgi:alpha-beta hydrolase superfamily lysophospholipase